MENYCWNYTFQRLFWQKCVGWIGEGKIDLSRGASEKAFSVGAVHIVFFMKWMPKKAKIDTFEF